MIFIDFAVGKTARIIVGTVALYLICKWWFCPKYKPLKSFGDWWHKGRRSPDSSSPSGDASENSDERNADDEADDDDDDADNDDGPGDAPFRVLIDVVNASSEVNVGNQAENENNEGAWALPIEQQNNNARNGASGGVPVEEHNGVNDAVDGAKAQPNPQVRDDAAGEADDEAESESIEF